MCTAFTLSTVCLKYKLQFENRTALFSDEPLARRKVNF